MTWFDCGRYPDAMGPAVYYFILIRVFGWVVELRSYRQ